MNDLTFLLFLQLIHLSNQDEEHEEAHDVKIQVNTGQGGWSEGRVDDGQDEGHDGESERDPKLGPTCLVDPQDGEQIGPRDRQPPQGQEDQASRDVLVIPDIRIRNHCQANDVDDCIEQEDECICQADPDEQLGSLVHRDPVIPILWILR